MRHLSLGIAAVLVLLASSSLHAGLYYSGETFAELPSQWRGFLLDQRLLRNIAVKPTDKVPASPERPKYEAALKKLKPDDREDDHAVETALSRAVKRAAFRIWERRPVVETTVLRV